MLLCNLPTPASLSAGLRYVIALTAFKSHSFHHSHRLSAHRSIVRQQPATMFSTPANPYDEIVSEYMWAVGAEQHSRYRGLQVARWTDALPAVPYGLYQETQLTASQGD